MEATHFAIAFLIGLIPALFWLWFWLREDRRKPEPLLLIGIAFIAGMLVVPAALPLQKWALGHYTDDGLIYVWVTIEESLKYLAALLIILWHRAVDEPIDLIIYMIAIALGFSALENALFAYNPIITGNVGEAVLTTKFRFLGATLLHVLASGTLGACLAMAYYKPRWVQALAGVCGLILATVLHILFNVSILGGAGSEILIVFLFVWVGIIILMLAFEHVKRLEYEHIRTHGSLLSK